MLNSPTQLLRFSARTQKGNVRPAVRVFYLQNCGMYFD
jgi:hypothetical protein